MNRAELTPILVERLATRGADEWFEMLVDAGVPCGPINTIDGGFAMAEEFALDPVVEVGGGGAGGADGPPPDHVLRDAGAVPAAAAGAGRAR